MPILEVEFDVYCSCGNLLSKQTEVDQPRDKTGFPQIIVEPCERCLDKANEDGYNAGRIDNYA